MNYDLQWHPTVQKFLRKLPRDIAQRIVSKAKELQEEPFRYLDHFAGEDCYKFRVGDYRFLVDVDQTKMLVFIRFGGHRKNVYKN